MLNKIYLVQSYDGDSHTPVRAFVTLEEAIEFCDEANAYQATCPVVPAERKAWEKNHPAPEDTWAWSFDFTPVPFGPLEPKKENANA